MGLKYLFNKFDRKQLTLTVTLLFFLINSSNYRYISWPVMVICLLALIFPRLKTSKALWLCIILIFVLGNILHYFEIDNHKFLYIYWSMAIYACLFSADFERSIRINAKLLIGLAFGLALIWKLISKDYLNNSFFMWSCLADRRFVHFLEWLHIMPREMMLRNKMAIAHLLKNDSLSATAQLSYTSGILMLSKFFTYGGIIIEAVIAGLFLLPDKIRITKYRDYPLFIFIVGVYFVAPVWEFGSILSIISMAQADSKRKSFIYIMLLLLMQLYRISFFKLFRF